MKRILFGLLLIFMVSARLSAQETVTTTNVKYWYYPSHNIYYSDVTGSYWYYDQPTVKWMEVKALPPLYKLNDRDPRYEVVYTGPDVWRANKDHRIKYKVKKDGTIKQKIKNDDGTTTKSKTKNG
ncbi:MAG TPA: hypothetical protein VK489_12140 [Ferruginibacter sp.]|nr:hypothetical protein [Ferruginibacter sp.]